MRAHNTLGGRCSPGVRAELARRFRAANRASRRERVAAVKNCRKTHAFISSHRTKKILSITTQQNMVDFDTIDKYVAAVKRGGVAIQMKQFHNLDLFIEEVVYDFKEYAHVDLSDEQKEYITATVSGDESYEHLINKNGENEDLHVSFSDITQDTSKHGTRQFPRAKPAVVTRTRPRRTRPRSTPRTRSTSGGSTCSSSSAFY